MSGKWNFQRELARKFIHFLSLFILLGYFVIGDIFNREIALLILVFVLIVFMELEYLRLEWRARIPILRNIWAYVKREKERDVLGGEVFFLLGGILVLAIFDIRVAVAAILMTTFGDMAAALVGSRFGKHYISFLKDKAWEGILAELAVNIIIGITVFFIIPGISFAETDYWLVLLVMAVTATVVETVATKIDDNLLIPLFSGFNGHIALLILGIL